jgi:LuxR family maltose regulon positive regulatory protein
MTESLLVTKLFIPPLRQSVVARTHLIQRLDEGLRQGRPLTLISAPAGFGKSTLVVEWIAGSRSQPDGLPEDRQHQHDGAPDTETVHFTWVSLEPADNVLSRFWRYVVAAVQRVQPGVGQSCQAMLQAPEPPPAVAVVTTLINELAGVPEHIVVVLDDYHTIQSGDIHESVSLLLDHLPANVHLVITTREDPPLALSRRRARRQVTEIRAADLRFSREEAGRLLNDQMRLNLQDADIARLETRTEGWVVGLQMAGLSLQDLEDKPRFISSFAGDDHYVADYLVEEVLQHLQPAVQSFLLRTSILERLSGPLCDAVISTGESEADAVPAPGPASGTVLEQLDHANLFVVPLDNRRCWYRYHHLFADLLHQRLTQTSSAEAIKNLHRRAAEWFEQNNLYSEAFDHALATGDIAFAARALGRQIISLFGNGELPQLVAAVQRLPWDLVQRQPYLLIAYGWAALATGQPQECQRAAEAVGKQAGILQGDVALGFNALSPDPTLYTALLEARVLQAQVAFNGGDFDSVLRMTREVLPHLKQSDLPTVFNLPINLRPVALYTMGLAHEALGEVDAAGEAFGEATQTSLQLQNWHLYPLALSHLAQTQIARGHLHEAQQTYESILNVTAPIKFVSPLRGAIDVGLGNLAYEWDHLDAARQHYQAGIQRVKDWGAWEVLLPAYLGLSRLSRAREDLQGAYNSLDELMRLCHNSAPLIQPTVDALRSRLFIDQGDLDAAQRWAQGSELEPHEHFATRREAEVLVLARLLAAQGHTADALGVLDKLLASAQTAKRWKFVVEVLVVQALAFAAGRRLTEAQAALTRAVEIAVPGGFRRTFLDEGEPLRVLLFRLHPTDAALQDYVDGLVTRGVDLPDAAHDKGARANTAALVEPLTERELEVLRLVDKGLSNQQIAHQLSISLPTVKSHITNMNGKLGTTSRTQSVSVARSLGILDR